MKERNYEFRKRMENFFLKPGRNPALKPEPGEVGISGEWEISAEGEPHPLLDRAVFDLSRFLKQAMRIKSAPGKKKRQIILSFENSGEQLRGCRYEVSDNVIRLTGNSPKGLLGGVIVLEERMRMRQAPFVKSGSYSWKELVRMRSTHSGCGLDEFPDWQLDAILHAGFTAIDLFIRGIDETAKAKCDINDIICRAEKFGLDVVLYSYMECYVHPDDPDADRMFDEVYGKVFRKYPKAKAIHLVGESLNFPSRDSSTAAFTGDKITDRDGFQSVKQLTGYYPSSDYPAYIRKISDTVHREAPDAEMIFNTYNWGWAPLEARKKFLDGLPHDVTLQVTYDIFKLNHRGGLACPVMDYSIFAEEPGFYFTSEVESAYEYGIRDIRVTSNLAGTTWDFGCVPYAPVPFRWIKRMQVLREYLLKYSVNSFYDSHHYGWWPNVCNDLARDIFSETPSADPVRILRNAAARDYGTEAAENVVEVWRIWSRAMDHYVASNEDQYGPWRTGPAYPFVFKPEITRTMDEKNQLFPLTENSYRSGCMVKCMYHPFENSAQSPGPLRFPVEIRELEVMEKEWQQGLDLLSETFREDDAAHRQERILLLNLGHFIRNMIRTTIGIKKWYLANLRLLNADSRESMLREMDILERLLAAERANVLDTIPLAETDSRLGWEPRMDYVCDPAHLQWKLRQLDNAAEEMTVYRELINL